VRTRGRTPEKERASETERACSKESERSSSAISPLTDKPKVSPWACMPLQMKQPTRRVCVTHVGKRMGQGGFILGMCSKDTTDMHTSGRSAVASNHDCCFI